ncbi:MAG: L-aspartate oxidase [Planctomycetota bacterium]
MPGSVHPTFPATLGGFDARRTPFLRCEVLVIGAGVAGCFAAMRAAEAGASVLLLAKSPMSEANTAWAQGGVAAVIDPSDSAELHAADTLRVGAGLADPAVVTQIVQRGRDVVTQLETMGVVFDQSEDGGLSLSREGGHSRNRIVHQGDATGAAITGAIGQVVGTMPDITLRTNAFVRDLLVADGRCVGAVALIDGIEVAIEAGAVVVATGGAGQIYRETTNPTGACGDGLALCFRAGATLTDVEFVQFHPTTLYIAGASRFLISEVVRGAGARLLDRHGERFMAAAHPDAELAPRDVVSRAILARMVDTGDTHVYLDLSDTDRDPHQSFPTISRICRAFDLDIGRDPIPVRPGAHYFIGGAVTNLHGETDLPGLLAAGEAGATGLHGANRLASNSLLEGAVVGRLAGAAAAAQARGVRATLPEIASPPPCPPAEAPRIQLNDMLYSLKSLMWRNVGLVRDAAGLREAQSRISMWHRYLLRAAPNSVSGLELANMLEVSALVAIAAAERQESRGTSYRSDHPTRDDASWCRRTLLRRGPNGEAQLEAGPLLAPSDSAALAS